MNDQSRALADQLSDHIRATIEQAIPSNGDPVARDEVVTMTTHRVLTGRASELRKVRRGCFTFAEIGERAAELERAADGLLTRDTNRITGDLDTQESPEPANTAG